MNLHFLKWFSYTGLHVFPGPQMARYAQEVKEEEKEIE